MLEFKPKWLAQSPSAPANSRRCRTCALAARTGARRAYDSPPKKAYLCPLKLVSPRQQDLRDAAIFIYDAQHQELAEAQLNTMRIQLWLQKTILLRRLRDLQVQLDRRGTFALDVTTKDFRLAMTLRDCAVFVRIPRDKRAELEVRVGDLDLKSELKADTWREKERVLIDEGWYTETEPVRQPNNCLLLEL
jgi:inositol-pentakisphosphate 2-kinase